MASQNRTITLTEDEERHFRSQLISVNTPEEFPGAVNSVVCQDALTALKVFPENSFDLIIADPPYNLDRTFNQESFKAMKQAEYIEYLDTWVSLLPRALKPHGTVYICCDWRSASAVAEVGSRYFSLQNRITWEREKGRGAKRNWKNNSEDIFFFTSSENFTFNIDAVKIRRSVIAPYKDEAGAAKDWVEIGGAKFRDSHPSNIWTDISVPFWSMPENTEHPTQKPEKLIAKLILASSNESDLVLDLFAGSGTTSVTAAKLNRKFTAVEIDPHYGALALKRLQAAETNRSIQGYENGIFYERNTSQKMKSAAKKQNNSLANLFTDS